MKQSVFGIISLILGILGFLGSCFVFGIVPSVLGVILAIIGFCQKDRAKGTAIAGLILSIIGTAIAGISLMFGFAFLEEDTGTTSTTTDIVEKQEQTTSEVTEEVKTEETTTEEVVVETEEEYKESCQEYAYKDVLRNPEDYVGKRVKIPVMITSVHEESILNSTKYYFAYSEGEYGWYSGDYYAIFDERVDNNLKLLSDDVIYVYGEIAESEYTSSLILASEEVFAIKMKYVELLEE